MAKVNIKQGKGFITEATAEHIEQIYPFMRKADQIEIACMGQHTPKEALECALKQDDLTLTALDSEGVPIAMFGVGQVGAQAYIWLLGTDSVTDNAYDFLKASRKWTQILTEPYGATFNFVHEQTDVAIKWLKFCGAKFLRKLTFNNEPFFEFIIAYKHV